MPKKPRTRKPNRRRMRRMAKAVNATSNDRAAAKLAGETAVRALKGVTVAEWRRKYPEYREMEKEEAHMSGQEWEARNAAMARGEMPSKIFLDRNGHVTGGVIDCDKAMDRLGNALGKLKDRHILTGPDGGAVQHELSNVPEAELLRRLAEHNKALNPGAASAGE